MTHKTISTGDCEVNNIAGLQVKQPHRNSNCDMLLEKSSGGQSATSATSGIADVALRTNVFKICCALIALRFQIFFG